MSHHLTQAHGFGLATELAKRLRAKGTYVSDESAECQKLLTDLAETKRRVDAGEKLGELSRRDPEALCALAQTRALDECEARMLLARFRYYEGLIEALGRRVDTERGWMKEQEINAQDWGRTCAKLGAVVSGVAAMLGDQSLELQPARLLEVLGHRIKQSVASHENADLHEAARKIADTIGQPGLEAAPERLAYLVAEYVECLRTERMPEDPELRELVRIASGMSAEGRRRLRELAELSTSVAEGLDGALRSVFDDWADADMKERL